LKAHPTLFEFTLVLTEPVAVAESESVAFIQALQGNTNLELVELDNLGLHVGGYETLASFLQSTKTLYYVNIAGTVLDSASLLVVLRGIAGNRSLEEVFLQSRLDSSALLDAVANILANSDTLTSFGISALKSPPDYTVDAENFKPVLNAIKSKGLLLDADFDVVLESPLGKQLESVLTANRAAAEEGGDDEEEVAAAGGEQGATELQQK